jgi:hypothetical protein
MEPGREEEFDWKYKRRGESERKNRKGEEKDI